MVRSFAFSICCLVVQVVPSFALEQNPGISGVSGTLANGSVITIYGQNFGWKSAAAPFKWDDFQNGAPPSLLSTSGVNPWKIYSAVPGTAETPQYAPAYADLASGAPYGLVPRFAGDISARQYFSQRPEGYISNVSLYLTNAPSSLYLSGWFTYAMSQDSSMRNIKVFQHNAGEWTPPTTRWDLYPVTASAHVTSERCNASEYVINSWGAGLPSEGVWHRLEVWHNRTSSNELIQVYVDGAKIYDASAAHSACPQSAFYIMSYADRQTSSGSEYLDWHWSELYIDNTLSRVELGNASTYAGSTHREIQVPSSWGGSEIQATVNKGSFSEGQSVWLYVINSAGAVNSQGVPVTIGSGDTVAPGAPEGLRKVDP